MLTFSLRTKSLFTKPSFFLFVFFCKDFYNDSFILRIREFHILFATLWNVAHWALLSMGILWATVLEQIAMPSSRRSSQPRDSTKVSYVSCFSRWVLYHQCNLGSPIFMHLHANHMKQIYTKQPCYNTTSLVSLLNDFRSHIFNSE